MMEDLEYRAIRTTGSSPRIWKRKMEATFVIQQAHKEEILHLIKSVDPAIQFTIGDTRPDGSVPFPDTFITPETEKSSSA